MKGIVLKSTGKQYSVLMDNGEIVNCIIRGNFRLKKMEGTNPVAVGDRVTVIQDAKSNMAIINDIEERKNYIIRKATNFSKQYHIIAANVDQAMLIATIAYPETSNMFIDRFLISAEAYRIPVIIVFNKIDLYNEEQKEKMKELCTIYEKAGYPCIAASAVTGENKEKIQEVLKDKITVISGNSGVGKSSLINAVDNNLQLKTGNISDAHSTGKHITTFAEMFRLTIGGYIIDTPGIRAFGIIDFYKEELYHYFPEIFNASAGCRFSNCTHVHEPGCAVIEAVRKNGISASRYMNYLGIFNDDEKKYR